MTLAHTPTQCKYMTMSSHQLNFYTCSLGYGPVGHTHNGNDAVHAIHNRVAGNFTSLTLGEFQTHFQHSWRKESNIPTAVVQEVQFDFKRRYAGTCVD